MPLVPEGFRCAVALALDWEPGPDDHAGYLGGLADLAADHGARLQFFVPARDLASRGPLLRELVEAGHPVDLLAEVGESPQEEDAAALRGRCAAEREGFLAALGGDCRGVRLAPMRRNGLHAWPDLHQALWEAGFGFVSSDYSTKNPDDAGNVGFADKNAAMLMKHQQPRQYASGLWEIPSPGYSDRAFFEQQGRGLEAWIAHLQQCVDFAHDMGGLLYAPHLHLAALATHDPGARSVRELLEHAGAKKWGDVGAATYRDVLAWASETP